MNENNKIHNSKINRTLYKVAILLSFDILYELYFICCGKIGYWNLNTHTHKKKIDRKHFQGNKEHIPHSIKLCLIIGCICICASKLPTVP